VPLHIILIGHLPRGRRIWADVALMAVINNAIPFTLIATGQTMIASGLASVINATTPLFVVGLMAMAGRDRLLPRKVAGILTGIAGVAVLKGGSLAGPGSETLGILCCLGAALCYGLSSLWVTVRLSGVPPLTLATSQLLCASLVMVAVAFAAEDPTVLRDASATAWLAMAGLGLLSTAFAYLVFFHIIAKAGVANVQLVTMIIPVSAILMGYAVLGETLDWQEILGALIIIGALAIIDGRLLRRSGPRHNPAR
jgi:drug/metabolite transporter (DMT)-like permease